MFASQHGDRAAVSCLLFERGKVGDQKFFNFVFGNALVFSEIYRTGASVSGVGEGYEGKFINCFGILIRLTLRKRSTKNLEQITTLSLV